MAFQVRNYAVVQLPVRDLEASLKWYQGILGIPFTFEYKEGDQEAWLNVGGVGLGLIRCPEVPNLDFTNSQGQIQPLLSLQVDNIHEAHEELRKNWPGVGEMVYKPQGGYSFTFRDPDGHLGNLWGGWPKEDN
ncbi:VOC family protein [Paenibacillus sp. CC-CFT747]|nr:VOC family protein [Paenibacillus sp. CC-CFT747]